MTYGIDIDRHVDTHAYTPTVALNALCSAPLGPRCRPCSAWAGFQSTYAQPFSQRTRIATSRQCQT